MVTRVSSAPSKNDSLNEARCTAKKAHFVTSRVDFARMHFT